MQPLPLGGNTRFCGGDDQTVDGRPAATTEDGRPAPVPGVVAATRPPQVLFADETLEQALRQLVLYGPAGLPVVAPDTNQVVGWITSHQVLQALASRLARYPDQAAQGDVAAEWARPNPTQALAGAPNPLSGYQIVELVITAGSSAVGRAVADVEWPAGTIVVPVNRSSQPPSKSPGPQPMSPGDRVTVLLPDRSTASPPGPEEQYFDATRSR